MRVWFGRHNSPRSCLPYKAATTIRLTLPSYRARHCNHHLPYLVTQSRPSPVLHGLSFAIPAYRPLPAESGICFPRQCPVLVSYYRSCRPTRDQHTEATASLPLAVNQITGGLCCCLSSGRCLAFAHSTPTCQTEFDVATAAILSRKPTTLQLLLREHDFGSTRLSAWPCRLPLHGSCLRFPGSRWIGLASAWERSME